MPTSDEDLQKLQDRAAKLREQVATEEQKRVQRERELSNDVTAAQLQAEITRLETRLDASKDANKVSEVKSGAAAPLEAAKTEMQRAVEVQKAQAAASKTQEREASKTADVNTESDTTKEN